jgi:hypothetical protein
MTTGGLLHLDQIRLTGPPGPVEGCKECLATGERPAASPCLWHWHPPAVTALFDPSQSDAFGWYSMGLLVGIALYLGLSLVIRGRKETAQVMAAGSPLPETSSRATDDDIRPERPARR